MRPAMLSGFFSERGVMFPDVRQSEVLQRDAM
jgi:hypothetical protein